MALVIPGKSNCPTCNGVLAEQDERFGTWGAFPVPPDLFPYCDGVMHWSCYAEWSLWFRGVQPCRMRPSA